MKSPFPGMDPYLERYWGDVHTSFLVYARNQLNAQLPDDLQARVEEGVGVEGTPPASDADAAEPFAVLLEDESRTERHLEIIESDDGGRVVTVIEVPSAANKVGADGRAGYARKQRDYLDARVNLVEIDLVREGDFVLAVPEPRIPAGLRTPYRVCVRRASTPRRVEFYPVPLRSALPGIRIPLRPSDRDVVLRLQPIIDACYRDGRYHRIDYRADPVPRFGEDDNRWIDGLLRENGLR